jgi:hypothetical protein
MKNKTILMAAVLAVATVLAAGLTVVPSSVQEPQASPCSNNANGEANGFETGVTGETITTGDDQQCTCTLKDELWFCM